MFKGFRDFVVRGNVIDLAVAVVVGAAFAALVKAVVDSLVTPVVNMVLAPGLPQGLTTQIAGQVINWSALINGVIAFLITVLVVYAFFVAPMNRVRARYAKKTEQEEAEEEVALLREIRDLLSDRQ